MNILDQPLSVCNGCGAKLTWIVSHGYHTVRCRCGRHWTASEACTPRMALTAALSHSPALLAQVLAAMEQSLTLAAFDPELPPEAEWALSLVAEKRRGA